MPVDPRTRFSQTVEDYRKYRPTYPQPLLDWVSEATGVGPPAAVADLGCGTGIFTRLLAARGFDVVGIDPNADMLEAARAEGGGARYQQGEANATGLEDASVSLVTVAQAFHWFDFEAAFAEQRRIAREDGWTCAIWNVRAQTPVLKEYDGLLRAFSAEYRDIPKARPTIRRLHERLGAAITEGSFAHTQVLDEEGWRGRVYSSSFVVHGIEDRDGFDAGVADLFARYAEDAELALDYEAIGLAWRAAATSGRG